jgi:hypothetical protein
MLYRTLPRYKNMRKIIYSAYCFFASMMFTCCFSLTVTAQIITSLHENITDTITPKEVTDFGKQRDLIDLVYIVLHKNPDVRLDSAGNKNTHLYFTVAPIVEYTIATGFSPGIAGNVAFMTSVKQKTNTSSFLGALKYTQKKQFLVPIQSSIWTPGNKYDLLGDWHYLNYPQDTYGFGGYTTLNDKYILSYQLLRLHELILRNIRKNLYLGAGYQFDYHWRITQSEVQPGSITDFEKYGFSKTSTSSGIVLNLLYDSRENSINPEGGSFYANVQFNQNFILLGANTNWNSIMFDLRKYIKMPLHSVLAFWFYSVITLKGNPPYLDLPGTGSDTYNNTGRGYEQGRFIGKKMVDLEAELRFNISRNKLIGGVIFGNAESLSELSSNKVEVISPAIGCGLRINFNKFSRTNVCIDYGVGTKGSRGFVGNLGEVF